MIAVPTASAATPISAGEFRRPMFRAAKRARRGRSAMTAATRTTPMTIAHMEASGRTILPAPRLLDDLAVPHAQDPVGPRADDSVVRHEDERLLLFAVQLNKEVHDLRGCLRVQIPGRLVRPDARGVGRAAAGGREVLFVSTAQWRRAVVR